MSNYQTPVTESKVSHINGWLTGGSQVYSTVHAAKDEVNEAVNEVGPEKSKSAGLSCAGTVIVTEAHKS